MEEPQATLPLPALQQIILHLGMFNVMVEQNVGLLKQQVIQIFLMPLQTMEFRLEDSYRAIHLAVRVGSHSQVPPGLLNPTWF